MNGLPRLFVVSGPAGVGKGTLVAHACASRSDLELSVSATTRLPRPGEIDGVSYHFLSDKEFDRRIAAGDFLEWADVHGHRYGTLKSDISSRIAAGNSVILEIDYQGAFKVRSVFSDAVLIFIDPPSFKELEQRLRGRATEDESQIELRLHNAKKEIDFGKKYDEHIVNDDLKRATQSLLDLIEKYEKERGTAHNVGCKA